MTTHPASKTTATGVGALERNEIGGQNTAIGYAALSNNTTGVDNIALGFSAGSALTTGSQNIDIGSTGVLASQAPSVSAISLRKGLSLLALRGWQ
jgi:trimeric autotransporter adhesin